MKTTGTRRFLSLLLALVLALGGVALAPIPAKAATTWTVSNNPTGGTNINWADLDQISPNYPVVWLAIQSDDTLNITQVPGGAAAIVIPASITGLTIDGDNLTLTDVIIRAQGNIDLTLNDIKVSTGSGTALGFDGTGNSRLIAQDVELISTNSTGSGIFCSSGALTISGTVKATSNFDNGINCYGDLTINGSVEATAASSGYSIYCTGALTVSGSVTATGGSSGIACYGDLTVSGSVTAMATGYGGVGISYGGDLTVNGSGSVSAKNGAGTTTYPTFQTTDSGGSWSVTPPSALTSGSLTGIGNIYVQITNTLTTVKRVPAAPPPPPPGSNPADRVSGTTTDHDSGWVAGEASNKPKMGIALTGGGTFHHGQNGGLTFTAEGVTPAQLLRVLVDLEELDAKDYDVRTGSTIVTLKESYLRTLKPGEYVLTLEFVGHTGETIFTVEEAPRQAEPIQSDNYNPNTGR